MADRLIDFLDGREPQGFESRPIYCRDGDFITLHLCDGDYYAERVDELLTVYLSPENNSLVGCKIKGIENCSRPWASLASASRTAR